jgi:flagellar hook protein FlgE
MVIDNGKGKYTAGGVGVTTQRLIDERGPLVATNNSTDLAVRGRGMLPVTERSSVSVGSENDFPLRLATTGSFRTDAEGYLTTPNGLLLLGWPANPDGSLPSLPRDTIGGLEPIRVDTNQFISDPTTNVELAVNLPATATEAGAAGDTEQLLVEYIDNLGISETLTVSFTPNVPAAGASNEWTMFIEDSASGMIVGEYNIEFDDAAGLGGRLLSVNNTTGGAYTADGTVSVTTDSGTIEIDIGKIGESGGLTQLSNNFTPVSITRNGSPVGNMTSVEVDANGFVRALFDNGVSRIIYQVPLVDVSNPNGLISEDYQSYSVTQESGQFFLWDAGDGPTGDIVSFAREESATDVAGELTNLIKTQRAYSSNAKVIQTVDEMLQETTNIKR